MFFILGLKREVLPSFEVSKYTGPTKNALDYLVGTVVIFKVYYMFSFVFTYGMRLLSV